MIHVFDGRLHVHYHQAYIEQEGQNGGDMGAAFRGQVNELCGAVLSGFLHLVTGLHTGEVGFTLDVFEVAPPFDPQWEEIVEAPLSVLAKTIAVVNWNGDAVCEIPLAAGEYRVRYCARGMDRGKDLDTLVDGDPVDFYSLTFWPAAPSPDVILKQTSEFAAYMHGCAGR